MKKTLLPVAGSLHANLTISQGMDISEEDIFFGQYNAQPSFALLKQGLLGKSSRETTFKSRRSIPLIKG